LRFNPLYKLMRKYSRRQFLAVGAAACLPAMPADARRSVFAYVGAYSSPQGPEGSKGNGGGIYIFKMDLATGLLTQEGLLEDAANPCWLAFHPSGNFLYAANEVSHFEGAISGSVTAYSVNRRSGELTRLNAVESHGAGPAHLSVHPSGKYVFVANYQGGSFAVLPVLSGGQLGAATDVKQDAGSVGPVHATSAPKGSFAVSGHERPHAHMIESDPAGTFVLGTDLGMDRIQVWKLNAAAGTLDAIETQQVIPAGDGPRHFVFHPNGRWLYSLQEEGSTVILFDYDSERGLVEFREQVSSLPPGFAGTNFTSEIRISHDGKFLYAANRLHDSIAIFSIGSSGSLTFAGEEWTRGDYPRSFTIDPSGDFLYSCNQHSDAVTCFRVNKKTGDLKFTGQYTPVGTPSNIVFLAV
jgi:6-phosphogluconolactonase (cycloisomerase 2 family)